MQTPESELTIQTLKEKLIIVSIPATRSYRAAFVWSFFPHETLHLELKDANCVANLKVVNT